MSTTWSQADYRAHLQELSTPEIVDELNRVRASLRERHLAHRALTADWQARELLAELAERQLHLWDDEARAR